jgi:hypothetical protein
MMIECACVQNVSVDVSESLNASERKHSSWIISFLAVFMARLHVHVRCVVLDFLLERERWYVLACAELFGHSWYSILIYDRHASVQAK